MVCLGKVQISIVVTIFSCSMFVCDSTCKIAVIILCVVITSPFCHAHHAQIHNLCFLLCDNAYNFSDQSHLAAFKLATIFFKPVLLLLLQQQHRNHHVDRMKFLVTVNVIHHRFVVMAIRSAALISTKKIVQIHHLAPHNHHHLQ